MLDLNSDIRGIIGSFHPSRPILTNEEIYSKILEINPEFSIHRLYHRYKSWYENVKEFGNKLTQESWELYELLKDREFYVKCYHHNTPISFNVAHAHELLDIFPDDVDGVYYNETVHGRMDIDIGIEYEDYDHLYYALEYYVIETQFKPSIIRPYVRAPHGISYSHIPEPFGDEGHYLDKYVNDIQELDKSFSLSKLYYDIHEQYTMSKGLDEDHIELLKNYLPDLGFITYYQYSGEISLYDRDESPLYNIVDGSYELFQYMVANIYHGVNTSEILYDTIRLIEFDTYSDTNGFKKL